jgi:hypothetical protein
VAIAIGTGNIWPAANTATPYDASITPGATPNGVCVGIIQSGSTSDVVTSVQYGTGGTVAPLTRAAAPYGFNTQATETGGVYLYWAGDSTVFPSGTQTVRVVRTGTVALRMVVWTMTVAGGQQVQLDDGATFTSAAVTNPAWTHTSLANNVVAFLALFSGNNTMTTTPATNWTRSVGNTTSEDATSFGRGWAERTLATAGALAPGWTVGSASAVGSSIAFKEGAPLPPPSGLPILVMPPPQP